MMHDRADAIDADVGILGLAIPNTPVQAFNLLDDHRSRHSPGRVIRRQAIGNLLQVLQPHGDVSGSRASLPRPSPLRTGRDDCSSSGSSLRCLASARSPVDPTL